MLDFELLLLLDFNEILRVVCKHLRLLLERSVQLSGVHCWSSPHRGQLVFSCATEVGPAAVHVFVSQSVLPNISSLLDVGKFRWIPVALRYKSSRHYLLNLHLLWVGVALLYVDVWTTLEVPSLDFLMVSLSILVNLDLVCKLRLTQAAVSHLVSLP